MVGNITKQCPSPRPATGDGVRSHHRLCGVFFIFGHDSLEFFLLRSELFTRWESCFVRFLLLHIFRLLVITNSYYYDRYNYLYIPYK